MLTVFFIALGLSMDAFAVSVAAGVAIKELRLAHALRVALFFGSFQALMPVAGWLAGGVLKGLLANTAHWAAFIILAAIGIKMIAESTRLERIERDYLSIKVMLLLSVATSLDALAVGVSLSLLGVPVITPAAVIGLVTFALSYAGVMVGEKLGHFFERKMEAAGGVILILIGIKILVEGI